MDILRPSYASVLERVSGEEAQKTEMEREAVLTSLRNLLGFPFVEKAVEGGTLTLHGTWLDIADGTLHVYSEDNGFQPV